MRRGCDAERNFLIQCISSICPHPGAGKVASRNCKWSYGGSWLLLGPLLTLTQSPLWGQEGVDYLWVGTLGTGHWSNISAFHPGHQSSSAECICGPLDTFISNIPALFLSFITLSIISNHRVGCVSVKIRDIMIITQPGHSHPNSAPRCLSLK